jgi:hypothetical protein
MRAIIALITLSLAMPLFSFGAEVVRIVREPGVIALSIEKGYGVQKDGKHELTITSVASGKTIKVIKTFKGATAKEDAKYFSQLKAIELPSESGPLRITGRIFYCSFEQKFCSVQRVNKEF